MTAPSAEPTDHAASPLAPFLEAPATRRRRDRLRFTIRPRPAEELPEVRGLLAGAALVDITPPPGMPKAGYSANANTGDGFHTRLRAAITHLRTGRSSLAIVQLDLLGGSPILQHLVAEAVADRTDVPLAGVWLGATHTHAGPGQFLGSDFYNVHASNKAGFDPEWTQFLADRIAAGIIEAHDSRGPAKLAVGTTEVWGLTRNRSLDPHTTNRTITDKRQDPQRKWVAVNPELHLLRVDRVVGGEDEAGNADEEGGGGGTDGTGGTGGAVRTQPLAAAVVFSIHGTGITQKAKEYNADLWAYLKEELGHRIEVDRGTRPVVGAMEGTHADLAPALRPGLGGHREARRIGCGIGAEAHALYRSLGEQLRHDVTLEAGLRDVDLSREANRRIDGIELPDRPAVGAALVAGAKENVTPVIHRIPPFRAGSPKRWGVDDQQGVKWVLGSKWLQPLMLPRSGFPRIMPLQMLRIDDVALVGLPFETTVVAGRRVAEAVGEALPDGPRAVVCSVVNDYWGYVTTAEEYSRQFYEGGHTLYGPDTQAFVAAQVKRLAADASGRASFVDVVPERRWNLHRRHFLPAVETTAVSRRFERRARFHDPTATIDGYWEQAWVDGHPGTLRWHDPIVRVESSDDDGATWQPATQGGHRIDDQGWALAVTHLGPLAEGEGEGESESEVGGAGAVHRYRVRWYDPVMRFGRRHRFVLLANGDRPEVAGDPFD